MKSFSHTGSIGAACASTANAVDFVYDGIAFKDGFRIDLLVEECVIVEVKSLDRLAPVHGKQLLTYLRLMNLRVGLILNFGAETMIGGLKRIVNDYPR